MNKPKHDSVQIQVRDRETAEKTFKRAAARVENDPDLRHAIAKIRQVQDEDDKKRLGLDRAEALQIISDIVDGDDEKTKAPTETGPTETGPTEAAPTDRVARGPLTTSPRIAGVKPPAPPPAVPAESPEPPAAESPAQPEAATDAHPAVADTKKQRSVIVTLGILAAVTTLAVFVILALKSTGDDETVRKNAAPEPTLTSTQGAKTEPVTTAGDCASVACGGAKTAEPETSAPIETAEPAGTSRRNPGAGRSSGTGSAAPDRTVRAPTAKPTGTDSDLIEYNP